ncbi:speedy protein E4-like [Meriones unguiculatus]|uniref:speedy protein E4-like n=1 Tax=Meriones unguiculatus TaxID=10047 RepID=UPI000B4EACA5|nr:speedy protein E4-like [Meriones unguiculatus]
MSAPIASNAITRLRNLIRSQRKKAPVRAKRAMTDRRSEKSSVSPKGSWKQNDSEKQVPEDSICLVQKAPQASSFLASSGDVPKQRYKRERAQRRRKLEDIKTDPEACIVPISSAASAGDVPEQRAKRKRIQKTKASVDVGAATQETSLQASSTATSEAAPEATLELQFPKRRKHRSIWTVDHIEGTKLKMNKKRSLSYRPEDLKSFYRLLEDPVVQNFLAADIFFRVTDKYLLSMVVEYFGRVGLPGHLYNRIHFFLALYIACDMEEDDPISKRSIFQFLLGRDTWQDLYKDFLKLQKEFLQAMDYRAWITREQCEEIQNQNPQHWVWSRVRQGTP